MSKLNLTSEEEAKVLEILEKISSGIGTRNRTYRQQRAPQVFYGTEGIHARFDETSEKLNSV